MEKQMMPEEAPSLPRQSPRSRSKASAVSRLLIASVSIIGVLWFSGLNTTPWAPFIDPEYVDDVDVKPFDWHELSAKKHLEYASCYDGEFQCARLELPMDYWNSTTNATISLAVIKKPAVVPVTHPKYGGPLLLNPGGPGGSGIFFTLGFSDHVRDVLEGHDLEEKYFDIMSFDPRGVGLTYPPVWCSKDLVFDESWNLRYMEQGVFSSSDEAFNRIWSLNQLKGGICSLPVPEETPDIKKYLTTASVARDMVELIERHGEWREKEAMRLLAHEKSCGDGRSSSDEMSTADLADNLKYRPGEEKINYLGFSYGSYLGNTFAAMFPDRINRLVVDGVVDAYDYTKSLWFDNVWDSEKDMNLFYYHCARVGYPRCALGNETGESTEESVKERTLNAIDSLRHHPLPVISPVPDLIYWSDIKLVLLGVLYAPVALFPLLAELIAAVERRDVSVLAGGIHKFDCSSCCAEYDKCGFPERLILAASQDATVAIACGDGDDQTWVKKADFKEHIEKIKKLSPTIGEIWATARLRCIHYEPRPLSRFEGPWVGNTSYPILEVGNTADPVTPGRYAKKMAEGFPGAIALIQDSAGHCSLASPSNCTESYVRRYFQFGELPEPGTVCKADVQPFGPDPGESQVLDEMTVKRQLRAVDFAKAMEASGGAFTFAPRSKGLQWLL